MMNQEATYVTLKSQVNQHDTPNNKYGNNILKIYFCIIISLSLSESERYYCCIVSHRHCLRLSPCLQPFNLFRPLVSIHLHTKITFTFLWIWPSPLPTLLSLFLLLLLLLPPSILSSSVVHWYQRGIMHRNDEEQLVLHGESKVVFSLVRWRVYYFTILFLSIPLNVDCSYFVGRDRGWTWSFSSWITNPKWKAKQHGHQGKYIQIPLISSFLY